MKIAESHKRLPSRLCILGVMTLVLVMLCEFGCKPHSDEVIGRVLNSVVNTDSTAVVKVTVSEHGATVPDVYRVYLGNLLTGQYAEVLRADETADILVTWTRNDVLSIHMPCGRIFAFKNFFYLLDKEGQFRRGIEVKLETSGVCSP